MSSILFKDALTRLESTLTPEPALVREVFDAMLEGAWTPTQIAAFAVGLRLRGETSGVIAAAAASMRAHMLAVPHRCARLLDTCGTGGDGRGSLNLSTGAAIIAAATGVPVAKHGNRAISSRSGSADVLECLGVNLDVPATRAAEVLDAANIAFLFAPAHHPALRFVAAARRELGVRTVFNCLGPLSNPARATHQLLGAYDDALRPVLARTLAELGVQRAWVIRSEDGMDEISPFAPTRVTELSDGAFRERIVTPADFGLPLSPDGAIDGGEAADNAQVMEAVLRGEPHPSRDAFILNAAAALCVADSLEPREAAERATAALDSGEALATLERWRAASCSAAAA